MTVFIALAIDIAILLIARRPGKPFRTLQPSVGGFIAVGILIFPICLLIAGMAVSF